MNLQNFCSQCINFCFYFSLHDCTGSVLVRWTLNCYDNFIILNLIFLEVLIKKIESGRMQPKYNFPNQNCTNSKSNFFLKVKLVIHHFPVWHNHTAQSPAHICPITRHLSNILSDLGILSHSSAVRFASPARRLVGVYACVNVVDFSLPTV